jgi:hypothetical protein
VSKIPLADFVVDKPLKDQVNISILTLSDLKKYEGFFHSLGAYLEKTNIRQGTFDEIMNALDSMVLTLQYPKRKHLILSPNSLTLDLGDQIISIPLSNKAIRSVLTWPAKLVNPTQ